ncbi:myb-like protein Q isoform X3 [Clytia hemisphaerica]|uniref:myb-like protein Q isoform X3 n=1 Tax=Clytia hemisphaerica TaxID=252671 RepID=UPI0034D73C0A
MKTTKKSRSGKMSLGSNEAKEAVATLRDRLKHGQNMTKILESQLDTAQQNISLLQGQVRLANETILNLKKYFTETENTLNDLFTSNHSSRSFQYNDGATKEQSDMDKNQQMSKVARGSTRSPRTPESMDTKTHHDDKRREREHNNKSPYAQQLRQVLDALQDEEPKKSSHTHHRLHEKTEPSEHSPSPPPADRRLMQATKHYHHENEGGAFQRRQPHPEEDYPKMKHHKMNGHPSRESTNGNHHDPISPKPSYYQQHHSNELSHGHHQPHPHSNHCMGPCCPSETPPSSYKMMEKSYHYGSDEKPTHYVEKSPNGGLHYIAVHSPESTTSSGKHGERHHSHHYVPYAYHIPGENPHKMIHEMPPQPLSPTTNSGGGRRKRAYAPLLPNEEPPHLKYTKVKRIDGSKLTAQKVLQDFTKRRFIAYNPRYDLDLLIVPPPIPASDLLKGGHQFKGTEQKMTNIRSPVASPQENKIQSERRSTIYGKPSNESHSDKEDEEVFTEPRSPLDDANNNNHHDDNNNNNKTVNNNSWPHKPQIYSGKGVSVLPSIKEEPRSNKLEDQINKLRHDQETNTIPAVYRQQDSPYSDTNNNNENSPMVVRENAASPIPIVRRTEQYCS